MDHNHQWKCCTCRNTKSSVNYRDNTTNKYPPSYKVNETQIMKAKTKGKKATIFHSHNPLPLGQACRNAHTKVTGDTSNTLLTHAHSHMNMNNLLTFQTPSHGGHTQCRKQSQHSPHSEDTALDVTTGEVGDSPCVVEHGTITTVSMMVDTRPGSRQTLRRREKNKTGISVTEKRLGPFSSVPISARIGVSLACCHTTT
jgi:hypothetical protein